MIPTSHKTLLLILKALLVSLCLSGAIAAQEQPERLVNEVPEHVPVKIEITDQGSSSKQEGASIKITNVSNKPIYHLSFYLGTPEDYKAKVVRWTYFTGRSFGSGRLKDVSKWAAEGDEFVKPGETITLMLSGYVMRTGFKYMAENATTERPRLIIRLGNLSFGDGTGFVSHEGLKYPREKIK